LANKERNERNKEEDNIEENKEEEKWIVLLLFVPHEMHATTFIHCKSSTNLTSS